MYFTEPCPPAKFLMSAPGRLTPSSGVFSLAVGMCVKRSGRDIADFFFRKAHASASPEFVRMTLLPALSVTMRPPCSETVSPPCPDFFQAASMAV